VQDYRGSMALQMVQEVCCGVWQLSDCWMDVIVGPEGLYHGFPALISKEAQTSTGVLT